MHQAAVLSAQSGGTARAPQPVRGKENATTRRFRSASLTWFCSHSSLTPCLPSSSLASSCPSDAEFILLLLQLHDLINTQSQAALQVQLQFVPPTESSFLHFRLFVLMVTLKSGYYLKLQYNIISIIWTTILYLLISQGLPSYDFD